MQHVRKELEIIIKVDSMGIVKCNKAKLLQSELNLLYINRRMKLDKQANYQKKLSGLQSRF